MKKISYFIFTIYLCACHNEPTQLNSNLIYQLTTENEAYDKINYARALQRFGEPKKIQRYKKGDIPAELSGMVLKNLNELMLDQLYLKASWKQDSTSFINVYYTFINNRWKPLKSQISPVN